MGEIEYFRVDWFTEAGELIDRSEGGGSVAYFREEVTAGRVLLFRVFERSRFIGIFTSRSDVLIDGKKELHVLHAVSCNPQERSFILTLNDTIDHCARKFGYNSWRVHSQRPGMAHRLEQCGFVAQETIYTKEV